VLTETRTPAGAQPWNSALDEKRDHRVVLDRRHALYDMIRLKEFDRVAAKCRPRPRRAFHLHKFEYYFSINMKGSDGPRGESPRLLA
jgi:hypothetical protein